jgi:hypothetical protein
MLLQGITDMPYIDMNTFPMFDQYITSFYNAFAMVSMGRPRIMAQQAIQALQ